MRDRFEAAVAPLGATINGAAAARLPNTSSVTFADADAEGIVIGLDLAGVAVSTGAACSSGRIEPSHVLTAMGLTPDEAQATIRVSLSRFTAEDEIDRAVAVLTEIVPRTKVLSPGS
jgi:cysteine desulfurase